MTAEVWAVWSHPIIRQDTDPVPQLGVGSYEDMEDLFFRTIEDESIDEFYIELSPADTHPA